MSHPRVLSNDEKEKLEKEKKISDFHRTKLETEAKKNWDLFYKRNSDHFFKDRHWLTREFEAIRNLHEVRIDHFAPNKGNSVVSFCTSKVFELLLSKDPTVSSTAAHVRSNRHKFPQSN